jgi:hypothetical protein
LTPGGDGSSVRADRRRSADGQGDGFAPARQPQRQWHCRCLCPTAANTRTSGNPSCPSSRKGGVSLRTSGFRPPSTNKTRFSKWQECIGSLSSYHYPHLSGDRVISGWTH